MVYFLVGYTHFRFRGDNQRTNFHRMRLSPRGGSQRMNSHRMRLNPRGGTQRTNYFRVGNRKRMRYHRKGDNCWNLQNCCYKIVVSEIVISEIVVVIVGTEGEITITQV